MKDYLDILQKTALFDGMDIDEIKSILNCFGSKRQSFKKQETIIFAGDYVTTVGIVLEGSVQVSTESIDGDRTILTELSAGDIFAETFVCAEVKESPAFVIASTDCEILFVEYLKIITSCQSSCAFHTRLIKNMLKLIAQKNMFFNQKMEFLALRTIRQKIIAYLQYEMKKQRTKNLTLPFKRQELSDYLCIDRSALSRELCKMRDEEMIAFSKNKVDVLF